MEFVFDGKRIKTREDFHNEAEKLAFMDGQYGRNLDALNDILRSLNAEIVFANVSELRENLKDYADLLIRVFKDAEEDNEGLNIIFR